MEKMILENEELTKNFLKRQFFDAWKNKTWEKDEKYLNSASLELQVSGTCDLKCKYCYYAKYSKDLYPAEISKKSLVLNNLDILLSWLEKNSYHPKIEIFSGELFVLSHGIEFLKRIIDWQIRNKNFEQIVIPTNMTFIFDDDKINQVEEVLEYANKNGIKIYLSASVDGKYCDDNRPFINGKVRDDAYYDKLFAFAKKWNISFHPMIYSENIEKWLDNFLWFQDMFKKFDIPFYSLYLLEVRNAEWTKKQIKEFYKFIRGVINWIYTHINISPEEFPAYVFKHKLFNLFNIFSRIGRGLGCSMQSTIQLRMGDLTASVCHRAAYKLQNLWKFKVENNEIVDIESLNHNLLITSFSFDAKSLPMCESCPIRELCSSQCLGSMYETNGELFLPIPTVCAVEHAKVAAILDEIIDLDLYDHFYKFTAKKDSLTLYRKYFRRN